MMVAFLSYCAVCYLMAGVASISTKHMPWFMVLIAPASVPITFLFIYCKALDNTFK